MYQRLSVPTTHHAHTLPQPRYLMGVGYPLDLVVCSALGVDMYDCVYPTRTARFGVALIPSGTLKLKSAGMDKDTRPMDDSGKCSCLACTQVMVIGDSVGINENNRHVLNF